MIFLCPVATAVLLGVVSTVCAAPAPASVRTLAQAPAGLRVAVTRTLAAEAAADPAYAIGRNGCARLPTPGMGASLTGCFARRGAQFHEGAERLGLRLTAFGRAGHLRPVSLTRTAPHANRIVYHTRGLREWWRVLPVGYEQGFTLNRAPAGHGAVVLQLRASAAPGNRHGTLSWGRLRYGRLTVIDADGHVLPARITTDGRTIALTVSARNAQFPITVDPTVWTRQRITASNGKATDRFGWSVAMSSNGVTALVGAPNQTVGHNFEQGAADVYTYNATTGAWTQAAELTAGNGKETDNFGWSVALSANGATALISAPGANRGKGTVYVYTEPASGGWTTTSSPTAELTADNGLANDYFGSSVALSANGATALIGAWRVNIGQGAAYIYTRPASGMWATTSIPRAELTDSNASVRARIGSSVALSADGGTALVGAYGDNNNQGGAYVYTEPTSGIWATTSAPTAELTATGSKSFGVMVALSADGGTALIGASGLNKHRGAAYVYTTPSSGIWATTSTPTAELTAKGSRLFGVMVALSANGATALIGAPGLGDHQGAAYVYTEPTSGGWRTTSKYAAKFTAKKGTANDEFGYSIALSSNGATELVGAPGQSAAYVLPRADRSTALIAPGTGTRASARSTTPSPTATQSAAPT